MRSSCPGGVNQSDARIPLRRTQLDPSLAGSHRLIGHDDKPENIDVELHCAILIADRNAGEFDFANHGWPFIELTSILSNERHIIYK